MSLTKVGKGLLGFRKRYLQAMADGARNTVGTNAHGKLHAVDIRIESPLFAPYAPQIHTSDS